MSGSRLRPYLGPVVALLVVLALGAGTVYAAIPNGSGTCYACLTKSSGVVRLINYPKVKCAKGERFIKWSQQGPAGAQGVQGPKGDPGPAGVSGSSNWSDIANKPDGFADGVDDLGVTKIKVTRVQTSPVSVPGNVHMSLTRDCPPGSVVTGGGASTSNYSMTITTTTPVDADTWEIRVWNPDGNPTYQVTVSLVCMTVEPAGAFATAKKGLLPASVKKATKGHDN